MADVEIPAGYGIPLVDLSTDLLPPKTIAALKEAMDLTESPLYPGLWS